MEPAFNVNSIHLGYAFIDIGGSGKKQNNLKKLELPIHSISGTIYIGSPKFEPLNQQLGLEFSKQPVH